MSKTVVYVELEVGPQLPPATAAIRFTAPYRFVSGNAVVLPAPDPVTLNQNGIGTVSVDPGVWFVDEIANGRVFSRVVAVPESDTPVYYKDLPEVSGDALEQVGYGPTWSQKAQTAAAEAHADAEAIERILDEYAGQLPSGNVANGLATLDADAKLVTTQIPTAALDAMYARLDEAGRVLDGAGMPVGLGDSNTYDSRANPTLQAYATPTTPAVLDADGNVITPAIWPDAAPEMQNHLNWAAANGYNSVTFSGEFHTLATLVVPDAIREVIIPTGSTHKVDVGGGYIKSGTIQHWENLPGATAEGTDRVVVANADRYKAGDIFMVTSRDPLNGDGGYPGWMRPIASPIKGTNGASDTVGITRPVPRSLKTYPKMFKITMAQSLRFTGGGKLLGVGKVNMNTTPGAESLISFKYMWNPEILDIEIGVHSRSAVAVQGTIGGFARDGFYIHDLYDIGTDGGSGGSGYGITLNGPSLMFSVLNSGRIERVRHSSTTNAGANLLSPTFAAKPADPSSVQLADPVTGAMLWSDNGSYGEPEQFWFGAKVRDCSNKSYDTHRLGWGGTIDMNGQGGQGGATIRADNMRVLGTIAGCEGTGILVDSGVLVPAHIGPVWIQSVGNPGNGPGIRVKGSQGAIIDGAVIGYVHGDYALDLQDDTTAVNVHTHDTASGVRFRGTNNSVDLIADGAMTNPYTAPANTSNRLRINGTERWAIGWSNAKPLLVIGSGVGNAATATVNPGQWTTKRIRVPFNCIVLGAKYQVSTAATAASVSRLGLRAALPNGDKGGLLYLDDQGGLNNQQGGVKVATFHAVADRLFQSDGTTPIIDPDTGQQAFANAPGWALRAGSFIWVDHLAVGAGFSAYKDAYTPDDWSFSDDILAKGSNMPHARAPYDVAPTAIGATFPTPVDEPTTGLRLGLVIVPWVPFVGYKVNSTDPIT